MQPLPIVTDTKKMKQHILVASFFFALLDGFFLLGVLEFEKSLQALVYVFLLFSWVYYDNLQYDYKRTAWFNVGLIAFSGIFFPIYLYKTRPNVKSMMITLGYAIFVWITICVLTVIGSYLYHSDLTRIQQ
jgi:hypothetical protein